MTKHIGTRNGFTLAELLIVISIVMTIITSTLVGSLNALRGARDARRVHDMQAVRAALELYRLNNLGNYPGYGACGTADQGKDGNECISHSGEYIGANPNSPSYIDKVLARYMEIVPRDPMHNGTSYFYAYDPQHCVSDSKNCLPGQPGCTCNCGGGTVSAVAFGFRTAETKSQKLKQKDTCSGGNKGLDWADYNMTIYPMAK